jgi:hypothetical protein
VGCSSTRPTTVTTTHLSAVTQTQDKEGGGGGDAADDNKFDEFMGADAGVFAGGQYDEDDRCLLCACGR